MADGIGGAVATLAAMDLHAILFASSSSSILPSVSISLLFLFLSFQLNSIFL